MSKTIAICNQKGGVGKTATTSSLGVALAQLGQKVLLVDFDPQGNLTKGLGCRQHEFSIKDALLDELDDYPASYSKYTLSVEGVDIVPANISLAGLDIQLASVMSRETVLKRTLEKFKPYYDYVLIDSNPALNLFTINTLVAADSLIIPVQAEPYATDGLEDLLRTINTAKKQLNPNLEVDGILITMTDQRTNLSKQIVNQIREVFGKRIKVFDTTVPRCVKTAEASLFEKSPITYSPTSESARAYMKLAKEVLSDGKGITKNISHEPVR